MDFAIRRFCHPDGDRPLPSFCHAELVSASGYWALQILNQRSTPEGAKVKLVIRFAHRKSYLISCYRYGQDDGDRPPPLNLESL